MTIRTATLDDLDALLILNQQIEQAHYEAEPLVFNPPSDQNRPFIAQLLEDPKVRIFAYLEDNKLIGFLSCRITINDDIPFLVRKPICRIATIVVDQTVRSKGVGDQLMAHCQQWALTQEATEIRLEVMEFNEQALRFYHRLGFTRQSSIMSKHLAAELA